MKSVYVILLLIGMTSPAFAQTTIEVPSTEPCFLNYTAGVEMWRNCGIEDDFLKTALMPWEYVTGGNFTLLFVSLLILATYVKFQKTLYPILIGAFFMPAAVFIFPESWMNWAIILAGISIGILFWDAYVKQTKDY